MEKKCKCCGIVKPLSEFSKVKSKGKEYLQSDCKTCRNTNKHIKTKNNPIKEALRKRKQRLKYKYNISLEDYSRMYSEQEGRCAVCGEFHEKLNVDHCHDTGVVRGLLCHNCNTGLGHFKDNSGLLGRAILYLKQTNTDKID